MRKITIIFILIQSAIFIKAQDPQTNLNKYWHYRYRLTHYFESVGMGQGQSLPAATRNGSANSHIDYSALFWGDSPDYLGYYLGVLAAEYRLLTDNN